MLIRVFAGCTVTLLVLSCRGSITVHGLGKTESGTFIPCVISLLPNDLLVKTYVFIFTAAGVNCVVALKSLPILQISVDCIFWSFGISVVSNTQLKDLLELPLSFPLLSTE